MIRIAISDEALLAAVDEKKPGWRERARRDPATAVRGGIWSEIKEVFVLLQEFKCIYCEFPLPKVDSESAERVAVDYDVEHFRPKNRVTSWPDAEALARRPSLQDYAAKVRMGDPTGYLRLALDPLNYLVSCKPCNSSYKSDRFPIAGHPDSEAVDRRALDAVEKPLLLFPFGERGDDPAGYLAFDGPTVRPRPEAGYERLRARAVIDFFELDTREGLLEGRCMLIQLLWPRLEERGSADQRKRERGEAFVRILAEENRLPHAACGRAFVALYDADRARAALWHDATIQYLTSKDPKVFQALG